MGKLLNSEQMRRLENAAIGNGSVTGLELMERAGRGVVEAILEEWPELGDSGTDGGGAAPSRHAGTPRDIDAKKKRRAVVLCGPGNNGGDGFVVARLLRDRDWDVQVCLYGDAEKLPRDARENYDRWGGAVDLLRDDMFDGWAEDAPADIIVDALFGTGLTRPFLALPKLAMAMNTLATSALSGLAGKSPVAARCIAIDMPSGCCADSGRWLGDDQPLGFANFANLTVTFHGLKFGHVLADGPVSCGKTVVKDIGLGFSDHLLERNAGSRSPGGSGDVSGNAICRMLEAPVTLGKSPMAHKYRHGHALILSGGPGRTGAARLAARGALRIGAGLVTVGGPMRAVPELAAHLSAIMIKGMDGTGSLLEMLEDERITALCLGPGLGLGAATAELVRHALAARRGTVLDADALSRFQRQPDILFEALHGNCVLTPHEGEFARLFPDIAARLAEVPVQGPAYSKVDAVRAAAARAGCVVLLKGADTVIAGPDGRCAINAAVYERAAPWLATAGAGDVLAGMICGLMARGIPAFDAAGAGAFLHSEAGRSFGPGLIAEDIPEQLPVVFRQIGV